MKIREFIQTEVFGKRAQAHACLVIYDPARKYREVAMSMAADKCRVIDGSLSVIEQREAAMDALGDLARGSIHRLVVWLPVPRPEGNEAKQKDPFSVLAEIGTAFPIGDGDEFAELCRRAKPNHVLNPHHPTSIGDSWAGGLQREIPFSNSLQIHDAAFELLGETGVHLAVEGSAEGQEELYWWDEGPGPKKGESFSGRKGPSAFADLSDKSGSGSHRRDASLPHLHIAGHAAGKDLQRVAVHQDEFITQQLERLDVRNPDPAPIGWRSDGRSKLQNKRRDAAITWMTGRKGEDPPVGAVHRVLGKSFARAKQLPDGLTLVSDFS